MLRLWSRPALSVLWLCILTGARAAAVYPCVPEKTVVVNATEGQLYQPPVFYANCQWVIGSPNAQTFIISSSLVNRNPYYGTVEIYGAP